MSTINSKVVCLVLISGRKSKDDLLTLLVHEGGHLINILYGRGACKASYLQDILGLVHEESKVVISCLLQECKAESVLNKLMEEHHFDKMNTGIAFTVNVDHISF